MKLIALDESFLETVGLSALPEVEKIELLKYIEEQFSLRVGKKIAKQLSRQELRLFDQAIQDSANSPKQLISLLKEKVPHYSQIVAEELEGLTSDIKSQARQILNQANRQI